MQQQFVAPIELNYNPENKNEIFGVPMDRALQLADELDVIVNEFASNESKYTVKGTGQYEGRTRLDEGAMLKQFVSIAKTPNEWAFVLYSANPLFENIKLRWSLKSRQSQSRDFVSAIASAIKSL